MVDEKQHRFLMLAVRYELLKKDMDAVREELTATMKELDYGTTFQDPMTSTVYRIVKPNGTFTYYRDIDYVRTAQEGERAGTLSKKEAEACGFVLNK